MSATATAPRDGHGHGHHGGAGTGMHPVDRSTHGFRSHFLYPVLIFLGTLCWLVGAALMVSIQPRDGYRIGVENRYTGAGVLFVVGASLFLLASLVGLAASYTEARMLSVGDKRPGLARTVILANWFKLIGSMCLVVGSALFLASDDRNGDDFNEVSAGAILWLIGSSFWLSGKLLETVVALVVGAVTVLMPEMLHRQRAWFGIAATLIKTMGWVLFLVGAAAMVIIRAPGFWLFGSLLWLAATALWLLASITRMFGTWFYFVPILSFATAAASVSSLVAGTAAQPGLVSAGAMKPAVGAAAPVGDGNATAHLHPTGTASSSVGAEARRPSATAASAAATTGGAPGGVQVAV